jgi:hypothetical protein
LSVELDSLARLVSRQLQLADVAGILRVGGNRLDRAYIEEWAVALGVADLWHDLASGGQS